MTASQFKGHLKILVDRVNIEIARDDSPKFFCHQVGGTKGCRISEVPYVFTMLIEKCYLLQKPLAIAKTDLWKGFDAAFFSKFIQFLDARVHDPFLKLAVMRELLGEHVAMRWPRKRIRALTRRCGFRQGGSDSMDYFMLAFDCNIRDLERYWSAH